MRPTLRWVVSVAAVILPSMLLSLGCQDKQPAETTATATHAGKQGASAEADPNASTQQAGKSSSGSQIATPPPPPP